MAHLSLFELNSLVKATLEQHLELNYWVVGEIGSLQVNQKGHCYMELVEKEGNFVSAKMRANIWSYTYRTISRNFELATQTPLKAGLKVLFNVAVQFHEVYGLSLNVKDIDPNFTLGERARRRQEVIDRLLAEGIYDQNRTRSLPLVPQRIAIISSETAAGYGDFMSHLAINDRHLKFHTKLFKATMQGDQAASSILEALAKINSSVDSFDLITIIRGGGSQLDLDCFDDYALVSEIARFPIPVITGIGHERDETITDLVAHTKMKTPTAVADFLLSGLTNFDDLLDESFWRIHQSASNSIASANLDIMNAGADLKYASNLLIQAAKNNLERKQDQLSYKSKDCLTSASLQLEDFDRQLSHNSSSYMARQKERLSNFDRQLQLVDPASVLKRGYSISKINGVPLNKAEPVLGGKMTTIYSEGEIESTITELKNDQS